MRETDGLVSVPEQAASTARRDYLLSSSNVMSVDYSGDELEGAMCGGKCRPMEHLLLEIKEAFVNFKKLKDELQSLFGDRTNVRYPL